MVKNKTIETGASVSDFLKTIQSDEKRKDCETLSKLISKHTKLKAKMWGPGIIGFGAYHYKYESGREGDAPLVSFSPRTSSIALYLTDAKNQKDLLKKFGKHKLSGGCIHIQSLENIDTGILLKLVDISIAFLKKKYPH